MISVVIPCYNAAATLRETIESALAQEGRLEVIVVDDGSTDSSPAIIAEFEGLISSVRTENRGVSAARNLGTSMATGAYIQYLDSDDLLASGTLAERRAALERTRADIAHTDWQKLVEAPDGTWRPDETMRPDLPSLDRDAEAATATSQFWAPPAALLYRRTIVEHVGAWSSRLPVIQDARFLFDAAAQGARFTYVPGIGAQYRVRSGSLSRSSYERFIADCATNAAEIDALWRSRGPLTEARREALAQIWTHVAMASATHNLPSFEVARCGHNAVAQRTLRLELAAVLRLVIGGAGTAEVFSRLRRLKAWLRGAKPL